MRQVLIVLLVALLVPASSAIYIEVPDYWSGIASAGVQDVINGRYGDVIFATDSGISVYTANGTWYSVNARHPGETAYGWISPQNDMVSALALDSGGHLWIGYPNGLQFQTRTGYESIQDQHLLKNLGINCMVRWEDDVWIATGRAGLHRYHDGDWTWYKPGGPENLGCHTIVSMVVDAASGALIIGSERDGVWMLRDRVGEIRFEPVACTKDWDFDEPSCIAVDAANNVYVADSGGIRKFDASGNLLATPGGRHGSSSHPDGIVVDAAGNIYTVEGRTHCVQKFDGSGNLLVTWGSHGTGAGEFQSPACIAIDAAGNVYVGDSGRIQKFDDSGRLLDIWDVGVSPVGIAIDATGAVYVTDRECVQKFDRSGRRLSAWSAGVSPVGIAIDASGNVYVTDRDCIQRFDVTGTFLGRWGARGTGGGEFLSPAGIAVDASGNIYVIDQDNHRIQKFDAAGTLLGRWEPERPGAGEFLSPAGIATDASGNIYVADTGTHRIQKFDGSGRYLAALGSPGSGDREFWRPSGVAVDEDGNIYVADTNNHRIQKLSGSGRLLKAWGRWGTGEGEFQSPTCIAVDAAGNVYVGDSGRIQKFDSSGKFLDMQGLRVPPVGIAIDASGNIYVADPERIQKYDDSGRFLDAWCPGVSPAGIAIDNVGNVHVADRDVNRIRIFDDSGNPLRTMQLRRAPSGIAFDAAGNIYVTGRESPCIQKFAPSPGYTLVAGWGTKAYQAEPVQGISEVRADPFGGVYLFNSTTILRYVPGAGAVPVLRARDLDLFPVTINDIAVTSGGMLLIASDAGIYGWDGAGVAMHVTSGDGIRSNTVKKLFVDAYGRCWFVVPGYVGYLPPMTDAAALDLNPELTGIPDVPTTAPTVLEEVPGEAPEMSAGAWAAFMEWLGRVSGGRIGRLS